MNTKNISKINNSFADNQIENEKLSLVQLRIKQTSKDNLDKIFELVGLTTTQGISMFLAEVERTWNIPLNLNLGQSRINYQNNEDNEIKEKLENNKINDNMDLEQELIITKKELLELLKSKEQIKKGNYTKINNNQELKDWINQL
jgi:addiction module RelB/DinJ family antitoxin